MRADGLAVAHETRSCQLVGAHRPVGGLDARGCWRKHPGGCAIASSLIVLLRWQSPGQAWKRVSTPGRTFTTHALNLFLFGCEADVGGAETQVAQQQGKDAFVAQLLCPAEAA